MALVEVGSQGLTVFILITLLSRPMKRTEQVRTLRSSRTRQFSGIRSLNLLAILFCFRLYIRISHSRSPYVFVFSFACSINMCVFWQRRLSWRSRRCVRAQLYVEIET